MSGRPPPHSDPSFEKLCEEEVERLIAEAKQRLEGLIGEPACGPRYERALAEAHDHLLISGMVLEMGDWRFAQVILGRGLADLRDAELEAASVAAGNAPGPPATSRHPSCVFISPFTSPSPEPV